MLLCVVVLNAGDVNNNEQVIAAYKIDSQIL